MTTTETILQCGKCLRQHDGAGVLRRFVPGVPELVDCGRDDCAAVAEQNRLDDAGRQQRRVQRRQARRDVSRHPSRDTRHAIHPACPPERPLPRRSVMGPDLPHAEQQRQFVASGAGNSDCEKMLGLLWEGFRADDPDRQARGPWITSHDLKFQHHIETPNSRASQLRGADSYPAHPLVRKHRLDVDCAVVAGKWSYSICFVEHSERLARERAKEPEGQKRLV